MTGRNLPAHGTQSRYKGSKSGAWPACHCKRCVAAHTRACKARELAHLKGQPPLYPAAPLVAHIKMLRASGMSMALISRRANVSAATIYYLVGGRGKSCRRAHALRILAVIPADFDEIAERPVLGSSRRIQALYAMGHNPRTIAAAAGLCPSTVSHMANGRNQKIDAETARAVAKVYADLAHVPGSSTTAEQRAKRMGWRDPVWWEDWGHIDDLDFDPDTAEADVQLNRNELAAVRRAEVEHLAGFGTLPEVIADRLGMDVTTVREIVRELHSGVRRDRRQAREEVAS